MTDRRLVRAFDRFARAALPDEVLRQEQATRSVINLDATVDPAALGTALSLTRDFDISGAVGTGTNVAQQRRVPQAVALWQLRADARTAPSGGECTLVLAADGVTVGTVSISAGATVGVSPLSAPVAAGALLTLNCTADNGAADISVCVAMRPS